MARDAETRKLATIVALDVAGYSARTEADEAKTTTEVAALRKVIEAIASRHGGRVFNTAGDGFMLEFGSSLAAVEAACELAQTCEPKVRVGVHLGDVVVQPNGDLLGHGVNVAARLMARSEPGSALVSGTVRQTIRGPITERLVSRGILQLDKMAEAIEAFALMDAASAAAAAAVSPPAKARRDDERRQITVLYGEYAYVSADGDDTDPEAIGACEPVIAEIVQSVASRFSGYIQRMDTDGLVLYFGYPEAREEDARRAVRCGLAIAEGLRRAAERLSNLCGATVSLCAGIDSGIAAVESQNNERAPHFLGLTRRAQRIVTASQQGQLVISAATQRLVNGYFDEQELCDITLPGSTAPSKLTLVTHESGARNRVEARATLAGLKGRKHELDLLKAKWDQTLQGGGQFVLLNGEAGMGKSRLLYELKQYVAQSASAWINECFCSPETNNRPLHPVVDAFQRTVVGEQPDNAARLAALQGLFAQFGFDLTVAVPLFAELLQIDIGTQFEPLQMAPKRKKELITQYFIDLMLARADTQPVLLVVEDLHWADPSFTDLIQQLVNYGPMQGFFCVCTTRPNAQPEWAARNHVTTIKLSALSDAAIKELVESTARDTALSEDAVRQLVKYAQGNPLYAEELTLGLLSGQVSADAEGHIPETLQESLTARLDALKVHARSVVKLAAVLGASFGYELLSATATGLKIYDIDGALRGLVDADVLYQRGMPPTAQYSFKHALVHEAAYRMLLKRERGLFHSQIAEILRTNFADFAANHPETLAHHLSCSLQSAAAVPYWYSAGRKAAQQSAPVEAQHFLQRGLDELLRTPESSERNALELDIQIALGAALMATKGYTSPEVRSAYERAIELCEASTPSARLAPPIFGLWTHRVVAGNLTGAVELGARLLAIAQEAKSEDLMLESHVLAGVTLSYCGPMQEALQHLDAAAAMYVKERHATHAFTFGQDPLMAALSYKGLALWWLGHPDQGQAAADDAVEIARKLGHARSLAFSLANGARCHLKAGDYKRCIVVAEECVELSTRLGFPDFRAMADVHICASRYRLEPSQETLAAIPPALAKLRSVGNSVSTPFYYSLIAEASAEQGHFEQAYDAVTSAHESLKRHGRDCDESEVYRATGVVHGLARKAGDERAEDELPWLRRALTVASEQGAVAWQLQAALTLAERQAGSVHAAEALALLREARTPFVEGKHLPTLRRADALLERTA